MRTSRMMLIALCAAVASTRSPAQTDKPSKIFAPMDSVDEYADREALKTYLTQLKVDNSLIQTIDSSCAVVIEPDEQQLADLRKKGEEIYSVTADDGSYYMGKALEILESLHIRIVGAKKRFLRLKGGKEWLLDIRKKNLSYWNVILFAPDREPKIIWPGMLYPDTLVSFFRVRRD